MTEFTAFKRIVSLLLVSLMLTFHVFAEETIYAGKEQSLSPTESISETVINNSDLNVIVIRKNGAEKTVIYTGPISGYDNGAWCNTDFSQLQTLTVYDLKQGTDESIYIIPMVTGGTNTDTIIATEQTMTTLSQTESRAVSSDIRAEGLFWNEDGYCEYIMPGYDTLGIDFKLKNADSKTHIVQPYLVLYKNGQLVETRLFATQTLAKNDTVSLSESLHIDGDASENYTAKLFNWEDETLVPLCDTISITGNDIDFYKNDWISSVVMRDFAKEVIGSIQTIEDTDYIKFYPPEDGRYTIKCFSTTEITASLYGIGFSEMAENAHGRSPWLEAGKPYYIKLAYTGGTSKFVPDSSYLLQIKPKSDIPEDFDVYVFDEEINVYKKSILNICDIYRRKDKEQAKQMYAKYEEILEQDTKLHELPSFLAQHPKELDTFDTLLQEYYGTKYEEFASIKQRYLDLIAEYETNPDEYVGLMSVPERGFISVRPRTAQITEGTEETVLAENAVELQSTNTPSLTITGTTSTSINYDAVYPVSGAWGNCIHIFDFNTDNGLTTWENAHGTHIKKENGSGTINNLVPGGVYVVQLSWSTNGGRDYGGENSICRYVKLPYENEESLVSYSGQWVTAEMEPSDKSLATNANFNTWLSRMDSVYEAYRDLTGYTPFNSEKILMKSIRDDLNAENNIVDNQNFYWVCYGYFNGTRKFCYSQPYYAGLMKRLISGDWGYVPLHEMSHVFDDSKWVFDDETLAEFKLYYAMETLGAKIYECTENEDVKWYTGDKYYNYLKTNRFQQSYQNSFVLNEAYASEGFAALLIDIQKVIGWTPFKQTFRYFGSLSDSQVPNADGDKLKLFLTKLKDYSGQDVLALINDRDTEIIEEKFEITLEYVETVYPDISVGDSASLDSCFAAVDIEEKEYFLFEFTPKTSGSYNIYTSRYGESGISNDTCIEIYSRADDSESLLVSNDDSSGGRFSKVTLDAEVGTTYYIKIYHYNGGKLHTNLYITKERAVTELVLGAYSDIQVPKGDTSLYSFTPKRSMTHVFEVENYNGGTVASDTYIKLYNNGAISEKIAGDNKRIIVNLLEGHTYYLQFSGFLMKEAQGRISVKEGETLVLNKKAGGSFLYVNNPEKLTNIDIVQPLTDAHTNNRLIYRQTDVTGQNTLYVTHSCSDYIEKPTQAFYYDVDFENPNNQPVSIRLDKLNHLVTANYGALKDLYYNRLSDQSELAVQTVTIPARGHLLLFKDILGENCLVPVDAIAESYYFLLGIFLDFEVLGGADIIVNTLAAYDDSYLILSTAENGMHYANTDMAVIEWNFETGFDNQRQEERDISKKMKGIDRTGLAEVTGTLYYAIEDSMPAQKLSINLQDSYYDNIHNPKDTWITAINPFNDIDWGLYKALPSNLHAFTYDDTHNGKTGKWYFDVAHLNPKALTASDAFDYADELVGDELNFGINNDFIAYFKEQASIPRPAEPLEVYPLPNNVSKEQWQDMAMMMGAWGVTYTYDIYVTNNGEQDRYLEYILQMANFAGVKVTVENLTTGESASELKTVISEEGTEDFIRQNHSLFNVELKSKNSYHIKLSILNGVGTTGFDNWLELKDEQ